MSLQPSRIPRAPTFPEIVEELKELLGEAAEAYGRVYVGIDELDKIAVSEQARTFLNEIKTVFGVSGCSFLVSVSEEAMNSFERARHPVS